MLYGTSKNKNGKDISDYDKYKPWNAEEFSGKIKYTLDNNNQYEVFREFNKKNPKIYNENLEDISNEFNIDKTKGNQFFTEQTGIDESLFFNTMTICQDEVALDNSKQNTLIQKITNVVSSGDDNVSYKKTMNILNKKLLEEVGTSRTTERPINIVEDEIKVIENNINDLELYKVKLQNMSTQNENIKSELEEIKRELDILKEVKEYKQSEVIEEQRIGINMKKLSEYNNRINELNSKREELKCIRKKYVNPIIVLLICIVITVASIFAKNIIITLCVGIVSLVFFILDLYRYNKYKRNLNKQNESKIENNKEIEIIRDNIRQCNDEINLDREKIEKNQNEKKQYLIGKYGTLTSIDEYMLEEIEQIEENIEQRQEKYNEVILKENSIDIERKNIAIKLEELVNKEERLQYLYEQRESLNKLSNTINLARQGLEEAYKLMKNTVTPNFTNELTKIIKEVTNGKYEKVNFNDENGLTVELENGQYVNCNRLSIGTIDQMYLALRLSILNEISKETMPIILDEAFAYYDEQRLENILKYISDKYLNRQIIVLTCTNREEQILDNMNLRYNLINM